MAKRAYIDPIAYAWKAMHPKVPLPAYIADGFSPFGGSVRIAWPI